jgi:hypothetical protein
MSILLFMEHFLGIKSNKNYYANRFLKTVRLQLNNDGNWCVSVNFAITSAEIFYTYTKAIFFSNSETKLIKPG